MELFKRYKCLFARYKIRRVEHINVEAMGAILDRRLPLQGGRNHTRRIYPLEGPLAGQHFIEDAAEAEQVASASTVLPCNCSGDMYCTVPRIDPATVSPLVTVDSLPTGGTCLARPKSRSFTPCFDTRI